LPKASVTPSGGKLQRIRGGNTLRQQVEFASFLETEGGMRTDFREHLRRRRPIEERTHPRRAVDNSGALTAAETSVHVVGRGSDDEQRLTGGDGLPWDGSRC